MLDNTFCVEYTPSLGEDTIAIAKISAICLCDSNRSTPELILGRMGTIGAVAALHQIHLLIKEKQLQNNRCNPR